MKPATKQLFIALGVVVTAGVSYVVWKKITATKAEFDALVRKGIAVATWPITATYGAVNTVLGNASAAASIPELHAQSVVLDEQLATMNTNDYAPGGRIYNNIVAAKGKAEAERTWQQVQQNLAAQQAETAAWWKLW